MAVMTEPVRKRVDRDRAALAERQAKREAKLAAEAAEAERERIAGAGVLWLDEPVWRGTLRIVGVSTEAQREEVLAGVRSLGGGMGTPAPGRPAEARERNRLRVGAGEGRTAEAADAAGGAPAVARRSERGGEAA